MGAYLVVVCRSRDSNPYVLGHEDLNFAWLPLHQTGKVLFLTILPIFFPR